ncbi:MAG: hypothetical protein K940chlam9_01954, partial [Chlamydiae bacterium]|nr:hypothetical protein [Chlamydiota bacterium]
LHASTDSSDVGLNIDPPWVLKVQRMSYSGKLKKMGYLDGYRQTTNGTQA